MHVGIFTQEKCRLNDIFFVIDVVAKFAIVNFSFVAIKVDFLSFVGCVMI